MRLKKSRREDVAPKLGVVDVPAQNVRRLVEKGVKLSLRKAASAGAQGSSSFVVPSDPASFGLASEQYGRFSCRHRSEGSDACRIPQPPRQRTAGLMRVSLSPCGSTRRPSS
jgi:hypothetical protein